MATRLLDPSMKALARLTVLASILLLLALQAPPTARATSAIGLSSGVFRFSTIRGKTLKGDLFVSNEGDTPIQVLIYSSDIIPDVKGAAQFVRPEPGVQPTPKSPASWTTINAPESTNIINNMPYVQLPVGKSSHVYFTINVPKDAQPGDFSEAIFFEMFDLSKGPKGTLSRIGGRLGCRIQIRLQGKITENVSVRPFTVGNIVFGSALPYSFAISNDGNIDHNFASTLQLLDSDEDVKSKVIVGKSDYVYAGSSKSFSGRAPAKELGLGKYTAELRVSYMKEALTPSGQVRKAKTEIIKQRPFYVVPLVIVLPLALLLLALLLYLISIPARRHRRAARENADPGAGIGPAPGYGDQGPPLVPPVAPPPPAMEAQPEPQAPVLEAPPVEWPPVETLPVEAPSVEAPEAPIEAAPEDEKTMPEAPAENPEGEAEDQKTDGKPAWGSATYYGPKTPKDQ